MLEKIGVPMLALCLGAAIPLFKMAGMADDLRALANDNTRLSEERLRLSVSNHELTSSLKVQTEKVSAWEAEAKKRKEAADAALANATKEAEKWREKYRKLLSDPPSDPANQGASLEERLVQYLEARKTQ